MTITNNSDNATVANIREWVRQGALFAVSHSGGKDSQAMWKLIKAHVPADQVLVLYADLGEVAWADNEVIARREAEGYAFKVVRNNAGWDFFSYVEHRYSKLTEQGKGETANCFPGPRNMERWCTGELKTKPIRSAIIAHCNAHGNRWPMVIDCVGIRAEESTQRSNMEPVSLERSQCNSKRAWARFFPIFHWTREQVFASISDWHWVYDAGAERSSCCFCIFGSDSDYQLAAKHRPELYPELWAKAHEIEERFRHTSRVKHAAFLEGGSKVDKAGRALRGTWKKDSWADGARLFAKSVEGRRLSVREWEARFTWSQKELF